MRTRLRPSHLFGFGRFSSEYRRPAGWPPCRSAPELGPTSGRDDPTSVGRRTIRAVEAQRRALNWTSSPRASVRRHAGRARPKVPAPPDESGWRHEWRPQGCAIRPGTNVACGHSCRARKPGMAERTPSALASWEAAVTTPRPPDPPTITGLPRSAGSSRCSADA